MHITITILIRYVYIMRDSDNAQPLQEVPQEEQQEAQQTTVKPKRKPRETKKSKVIVVSVKFYRLMIKSHQHRQHHQRMTRRHQHLNLDLKQM